MDPLATKLLLIPILEHTKRPSLHLQPFQQLSPPPPTPISFPTSCPITTPCIASFKPTSLARRKITSPIIPILRIVGLLGIATGLPHFLPPRVSVCALLDTMAPSMVTIADGSQPLPQQSSTDDSNTLDTLVPEVDAANTKVKPSKTSDSNKRARASASKSGGPSSGTQSARGKTPKKRKFDVEPGPDLSTKPLSNLREIVAALIASARPLGLDHYVDSGNQFFIRVGTLCSGTDAPLHVLNLFGMLKNDAGEQVFTTINAFACEIEPFKQGFLQRNSKPGLLFRDAQDFTKTGAKRA